MIQESIRKTREKQRNGEGGFTLVELLIVIVILGILAAIVVLAIGGLSTKSKLAACNADGKTIEVAEDAYYASPSPNGGDNTNYTNVAGLLGAGLLKSDPNAKSNRITVTGGAGTYDIKGVAGSDCASMTELSYP
jgi:general secretion pathway protein G